MINETSATGRPANAVWFTSSYSAADDKCVEAALHGTTIPRADFDRTREALSCGDRDVNAAP
ncbi:DUF397 domain-containing protein [Streptomyces lavendulae]|nr:DUF397 domain-containing protein [Streptomyces lavendulae]